MRPLTFDLLLIRLSIALMIVAPLLTLGIAQKTKSKATPPISSAPPAKPLELSYTLSFPQPHTHLYEVAFTIGNVSTPEIDLQLPTWTPGSYLQREYARNVQDFSARDDTGQLLPWQKVEKATWRIASGASNEKPKTIRANYRVYANELFTQTSHLDATHAYFNGASLFMYVPTAKDRPHRIKIITSAGNAANHSERWRVSSPLALEPDADGFFTAADYDRLVDSPTEIGTHRLLEFTVRNKLHRVALWGDFDFDENRLKGDLAKIVETGAQIFGGLPYDHYLFIIHVQPNIGSGGTEHLNSNISMTTPTAFRTDRGYKGFLGLESHEYFHHWNVKRIRPVALGPFDYQRENYTKGLWVSEGITSYYGDLILRRAGLTSPTDYYEGLGNLMAGYDQSPGRFKQSAESASFDAWIKHYRPDANSPNTAMSYYTKGEILGLLFDLEIRSLTGGAKSLDDVMRLLLEKYGLPKPGFTDVELKAAFEQVAGTDLSNFWRRYVTGNDEIDFAALLLKAGLQLKKGYLPTTRHADSKTDKPGTLGFRTRPQGDRIIVTITLAELPAYESGINTGDEIVAIDNKRVDAANAQDRLNDLRAGQRVRLTIFRREHLMSFELTAVTRPFERYEITELKEAGDAQKTLRRAWLNENNTQPAK